VGVNQQFQALKQGKVILSIDVVSTEIPLTA